MKFVTAYNASALLERTNDTSLPVLRSNSMKRLSELA